MQGEDSLGWLLKKKETPLSASHDKQKTTTAELFIYYKSMIVRNVSN
jgi:hypothetical protein